MLSLTKCIANSPSKPLGPALWHRKQLAARGYEVVVVNGADWKDLEPDMRQLHLHMLFKGTGAVLPAE